MDIKTLEKEYIRTYEKEIGISKIIEDQKDIVWHTGGKQGKKWLALSPRLINEEQKINLKTNYEIAYWVNYGDDETYGMFSVEKITQWLTTPDLLLYKLGGKRERVVHVGK